MTMEDKNRGGHWGSCAFALPCLSLFCVYWLMHKLTMKVLCSPIGASFGVLGGSHPNLVSLEWYRPAETPLYLPHGASHGMGEDVGSHLDLFWGREKIQQYLRKVHGKGSKELHPPSKLVASPKLGCNELGRSLQPSSMGYFCLPAAETLW